VEEVNGLLALYSEDETQQTLSPIQVNQFPPELSPGLGDWQIIKNFSINLINNFLTNKVSGGRIVHRFASQDFLNPGTLSDLDTNQVIL
jgi:hypothetical protein